MLGYAMPHQMTLGIRNRLRSRAFVVESICSGRRLVLVTADVGLLTQAVQQDVVRQLKAHFGDRYGNENVLLAATHTHSAPGGYSHYILYNLTILGFSEASFRIVVDGIVESISRADSNLAEASIHLAQGDVANAGINRSSIAYQQNPPSERARYGSDTDQKMVLLRFDDAAGNPLGLINWFGVHATSMGNQNHLINGDNKGYAAHFVERRFAADYSAPKTFVAAFAQGSEGDVSPNIFGGTDGGGDDDFESVAISGRKQAGRALELMDAVSEPVRGPVDARQAFVKMDEVLIVDRAAGMGGPTSTCPAAIGFSMLAGAEDGRGVGPEGLTCADPDSWWRSALCGVLTSECQGEKPIALEMGSKWPHPWTPEVLPLQIARIGQLAIVALPFEITTMAGRRLRDTVAAELGAVGVSHVVVAGLANAYSGYVVTREEYRAQHYEGASTHFGPWTLAALRQEFSRLAVAMRDGRTTDPGPEPRDLSEWQVPVAAGPTHDATPFGVAFGDVYSDVRSGYRAGETVRVSFAGAYLSNDPRTQGTFLSLEKRDTDWRRIADDDDWETHVSWQRDYCLPTMACSTVTIVWEIPEDVEPGTYRIRHMGAARSKWSSALTPYAGTSAEFQVVTGAAAP